MAGFDIEAALNGLAALIETNPAIEHVQIGAPESLSNRISAWVTIGDPDVIESVRFAGICDLSINLIAWFGYTVEGAESAAEAQLADYISDLTRRLMRNRSGTVDGVTRNLNGSVEELKLPQAAAGGADYTLMAGAEQRTYPLGIRVIQRESIT